MQNKLGLSLLQYLDFAIEVKNFCNILYYDLKPTIWFVEQKHNIR